MSRSDLRIDKFKANFDAGARPNRFNVNIMGPTLFQSDATDEMPFQTNDGGEVSFSFYCDQNFLDRAAIEGWQDSIYGGDPTRPRFSFKDEYKGTVEISVMNGRGKDTLTYELIDAYPIKYEQQDLDYSSNAEIMSFTVTMAYTYFKTKYTPDDSGGGGLNRGRRILDALIGVGQQTGKYTNAGQSVFKRLRGLDDKLAKVQRLTGG